MLDWAVKSGLGSKGKTSLDRPSLSTGIPGLDDLSVVGLAKAIAPFHKRNFLVMELSNNLSVTQRAKTLEKFSGFKKRAAVLMGEPSSEYKAMVQSHLLNAKKAKVAAAIQKKVAAEERVKKLEAVKKARLEGSKKDGEVEAEVKAEEKAEEPSEPVTLSDEAKSVVFRKLEAPYMAPNVVANKFATFSIPAQSEGFDAIDFLWQKEGVAKAHLQSYIQQKKLNSRVDSLVPGDWCKKEWKEFLAVLSAFKQKQSEWKNPATKKAKIAAEEKAAKGDDATEADAEPMKIDAEDLDVFSVADVNDIGSGEPLYANFQFEDWALLAVRFELHLLVHAFRKDIADSERPGFHESHVGFYYNKYFNKQWSSKNFGRDNFNDVVELIKENVSVSKTGILEALLGEDAPVKSFVHLVEEHRRDRQRRFDAGVESAQLKFQRTPQAPAHSPQQGQQVIRPPQGAGQGVKRPIPQQTRQQGLAQQTRQQGSAPWKQARTIIPPHAAPRTIRPVYTQRW
jgi:hypothetical protein